MTIAERQEFTKPLKILVEVCLEELIKDGFISFDQINQQRWYIKWCENDQLKNEKFLAAASIDDLNRPYLLFDTTAELQAIVWAIPHEVIHLAQICKGDLLPCYGYSLWKGERYDRLKADDPDYTANQPWEAQVSVLEDNLRTKMYARHPELNETK